MALDNQNFYTQDEEYNTEFNKEFGSSRFDTQNSFASQVTGGAIATVADFGTSVYNSLPFTDTIETQDVLSRISDNALRVYEENTDTINTLSFIGGSFIPGGFALKGMNALRNGAKAASWFSTAGKVQNLAKVEDAIAMGASGAKAYRAARNEIFRNGVLNNVVDAAAAEVLILGTMNASPLMEDYFEEPVKNFAISLAFGGVLGGGIGAIADNFQINKIVGNTQADATFTVFKEISKSTDSTLDKDASLALASPSLGKLQVYAANQKALQKIVDDEGTAYNGLTKEFANKVLLETKAAQEELFTKITGTSFEAIPKESKDAILSSIVNDSRMVGGDKIDFFNLSDEELQRQFKSKDIRAAELTDEFAPVQNKATKTTDKIEEGEVESIDDVIFLKEFNRFATPKEALQYTRANALNKTEQELLGTGDKFFGVTPNTDAVFDLNIKSSSYIDLQYIKALKEVDSMTAERAKGLVISPDDPYILNAIAAKMAKDPEAFKDVQFTLTNNRPRFAAVENAILSNSKVGKHHLRDIEALAVEKGPYDILKGSDATTEGISNATREILNSWVGNNPKAKSYLRNAFDANLRGQYFPDLPIEYRQAALEIRDAPASVAFRKKLSEIADEDGNVYLYRGLSTGKANGSLAVESYTPSLRVAQGFTNPQLFKIPVEDVIANIGGINEYEILVSSAARPAVAKLPLGAKLETNLKANGVDKVSGSQISEALLAVKEKQISSLMEDGFPLEAIAIRTNTPLETVQAFATGLEPGQGFSDLFALGGDFKAQSYTNAEEITSYLAPELRPLRIKSNVNKVDFAKLNSSLDTSFGAKANTEFMDVTLQTSKSYTAKEFHRTIFGTQLSPQGMRPVIDMLRAGVHEMVNGKLGNAFLSSSDHFLRNTSVGAIVTTMGKEFQAIATKSAKRVTEPLTQRMADVATDAAALVEANVALSVNAGLKGARKFEDNMFWQKEKVTDINGKATMEWKPVQYNGSDYVVQNESVSKLLEQLQYSGRELFELKNTINKTMGKSALNDLGFWVPSFNPNDKYIGYVWDKSTNTTKILWGKTEQELIENTKAFEATIPLENRANITIVNNKSEQALYNQFNNRLDPLTMEIANVEKFHTGSAQTAIVRTNTDVFGEIIGGFENYFESHTKQMASVLLHDVIDSLDNISKYNTRYFDDQPLNAVQKLGKRPEDGARVVKNTLLGNSNLNQNTLWKQWNQNFETYTTWGLDTVSKSVASLLKPFGNIKKGLNEDSIKNLDYEKLTKELEAQGIQYPWQAFDDAVAKDYFKAASVSEAGNTSKRVIYASNAFAATMALRVADLAQPLVNAISLPILTTLAKSQSLPESFMGVQKGTAKASVAQVMYEGARLAASPMSQKLDSAWEAAGYFDSYVSEANSALRMSRQFDKSITAKVENALDSSVVNWLSKPSDVTEAFLRRQTMYTGYTLAKKMYPELNDTAATIFARDFMDRSMGNYHAPQRPVFFQGTMGVALGLFQTYMLTLGQGVYRSLELKDYKALGKAALVQSSIFGTSSMPGFDMVSGAIGDHFSDDNIDLTTGTYRALEDNTANAVLYGLPSSLGPALYTRGDIAPRINTPFSSPNTLAAVNMISQTIQFGANVSKAVSVDNASGARAIADAFSLQSVSRPMARVAELMSGYSITGAGNTIQTPEEVYTFSGVASRLLSTRPIEEAKLREMNHLDTVYGTLDREHRQKATKRLKALIRAGDLDDENLATIASDYMKFNGTPTGWRSAVNKAIAESNTSGKEVMMKKLEPNSPLNHMIDSLDGE